MPRVYEPLIRAFIPRGLDLTRDPLAGLLLKELAIGSAGRLVPIRKGGDARIPSIAVEVGTATFRLAFRSGPGVTRDLRSSVGFRFWGDRVRPGDVANYDRAIDVGIAPSDPESLNLFNSREEVNAYVSIVKVLRRWDQVLLEDAWECRPFDDKFPYDYH